VVVELHGEHHEGGRGGHCLAEAHGQEGGGHPEQV
jgi:hypothetical protein